MRLLLLQRGRSASDAFTAGDGKAEQTHHLLPDVVFHRGGGEQARSQPKELSCLSCMKGLLASVDNALSRLACLGGAQKHVCYPDSASFRQIYAYSNHVRLPFYLKSTRTTSANGHDWQSFTVQVELI